MLTSVLGARLSWHFANGWVFEPAIVGPDIVDYTLKEATQGRGDNQDPAFIEKIRKLSSEQQDWPRHILNDEGYFKVI